MESVPSPSPMETNTPMTSPTFKRIAIPTALVVGGVTVGSFVAPIGLVSAQETDADADTDATESDAEATESDDSESTDEDRHRRGRHGLRVAKAEVLEDVLGLSADEIREALADGGSLADLAEAQGVAVDELEAALVAAATERIEEAVADGEIDAERADEVLAELDERVAEMVTRVPSEDGAWGRGHGRGHGHGLRGGVLKPGSEAIQDLLGLTSEEIRAGMAEGQSLADLAEAQGVAVDDLVAALVAEAAERIDEKVADGTVDADRAAEAAEQLEEMIERAVEAEPFDLGRGIGRAEGRRGFHHHRGGPGLDDSAGVESSDDGDVVDASF